MVKEQNNNSATPDIGQLISDKGNNSQGNSLTIRESSISVTPVIPKERGQFLSILKIRNFMLFSLSQAVSLFGDKLDYMALLAMIAYFADKLGWQSARAISYLSVVITLPTILFGPLAGVLVDRWNRLKVLIFCDSSRAVLVAIIPLIIIQSKSLYLVYFIVFIVFIFGLFFNTARLAIIPNLVAKRRLLAANSFMNFIGRVATFLGMFFGGLIVDWQFWQKIGITHTWSAGFYIDALTYLVSVTVLLIIAIKTNVFHQKDIGHSPLKSIIIQASTKEKNTINEIKLAIKYISKTPPILFVFTSIILTVIIGASVFILLVPIIQLPAAKMGFGVGTKGVGFVAAIGAVGLVLSSMGFGIIGHKINKQYMLLISFIVLGIIAIIISLLNSFVALIPMAFIAGLFISPIFIIQDTMLHEILPEAMRGRIFSTREWILHLSFALACLTVGELTNFFTPRHLLSTAGIVVIITSIIFIILFNKRYHQ
ncbi:MAG: MFS transporter [candidate division WOR-3 bacterium]